MTFNIYEQINRVIDDLRPILPFRHPDSGVRTLHDRMAELSVPGVSIAVIDNFDVAWIKGFGIRKKGLSSPVVENTPFQAGSISKTVFALAMMRLHQDKQIDLDADITTYLTSWRLPVGDNGWVPKVTLRQLLSHSAGATVHGFPGYSIDGSWPTITEILDGASPANNPPVFFDLVPGMQVRYSGGGTTIAQLAVTEALDQPLPDLIQELVLNPLGMHNSSYEQPPSQKTRAYAAAGHLHNAVPIPGDWHVYPEMAAAGLWTTAGDLARLGIAVMRGLRGEATGLGLFPETLGAMLQPQVPGQSIGMDFTGLGWFCTGKDEQFRFGHSGSNYGFLAELRLCPAKGQGAIVMVNSYQGWPLVQELIESIEREYEWPNKLNAANSPRIPISTDYSGFYRETSGVALHVKQEQSQLFLSINDQNPIALTQLDGGNFIARIPRIAVRFTNSSEGTSLTLTQENRTFDAVRVLEETVVK